MKIGMDMVQEGYNLLKQVSVRFTPPNLSAIISGGIYQYQRPDNSKVEDIVVNSLALSNSQLQEGFFNVNCHVPNKQNVVIGGQPQTTQPDIVRLKIIAKAVAERLDNYIGSDYRFRVQMPGNPIQDADLTWYINIRVFYNSIQNQYKFI